MPVLAGHRPSDGAGFFFPLSIARERGAKVARMLGEPFAEYAGVIGAAPTPETLRACLADLRRQFGVDVVVFRRVPDQTTLAAALDALGAIVSSHAESPYVPIGPDGPIPNAQGGQSFGYREGCRRRRKLQKSGAYEFQVLRGGPQAHDAIRLALDWKKAWVEERGLHSRLRNDALFAQATCRHFGSTAYDARIGVLVRNGEPVAVETGFAHRDRFYADLCSYRPDQRADGVGKIAFTEMIEWAGRAGLTAYDKGPPADSYKKEWTDRALPVADRTLALSLVGRLHGGVETQVKPMLKASFRLLPPAIRNAVLRIAAPGSATPNSK